jgi:hypothetical protein
MVGLDEPDSKSDAAQENVFMNGAAASKTERLETEKWQKQ